MHLSLDDILHRRSRLHPLDAVDMAARHHAGDHVTDPSLAGYLEGVTLKEAAVLIPVLDGPGGRVLMTRRTDHLKAHAGQIAFPGGKIDPGDDGPVGAALREAEEEIGLNRAQVRPIGLLSPYISNSGYRIVPVVASVDPAARLEPNPGEVAEIFDVPLGFLMEPTNHLMEQRPWRGADRRYFALHFEGRRIWGVTAGIVRLFYDEVFR